MNPTAGELLESMRTARNRDDVWDAVVQLRDLAYDEPAMWKGLSAEHLFYALLAEVDRAADDALDWQKFGALIGSALVSVLESLPAASE